VPAVHLTNLLIVVAVGLLAPLALGFFPRVRLPAMVLEILLGVVRPMMPVITTDDRAALCRVDGVASAPW